MVTRVSTKLMSQYIYINGNTIALLPKEDDERWKTLKLEMLELLLDILLTTATT
jgi:hypothetical protein